MTSYGNWKIYVLSEFVNTQPRNCGNSTHEGNSSFRVHLVLHLQPPPKYQAWQFRI
jgi:hypothetical protein